MFKLIENQEEKKMLYYSAFLFITYLFLRIVIGDTREFKTTNALTALVFIIGFSLMMYFFISKNYDYFIITWLGVSFTGPLMGIPGLSTGAIGLLNLIFIPLMILVMSKKDKIFYIIIALFVFCLFNTANTDFKFIGSRLFAIISPFIFLYFSKIKCKRPKLVLKAALIIAIFTIPLAIFEFIFQPNWGVFLDWRGPRVLGNLDHPNGFAFYLAAPIILSYAYLKTHKFRNFMLITPILFLGTLMTFSRGGIFSTLVGIIAFEFLYPDKLKLTSKKAFISVLLVATIILYLITQSASEKLGTDSIEERTIIWNTVMPYILENPIFGNGVGSLEVLRQDFYGNYQPHNYYLLIMLELGLIGILIYASIFYLLISDALKFSNKDPSKKNLLPLGSIGIYAAIFVYSFYGDLAFSQYYGLTAWIIAGLLTNLNIKEVNKFEF